MIFKKITASKYIGSDGFQLKKLHNSFVLCKDNRVAKWSPIFSSIKLAQMFLDKHDYIRASADYLPLSADDIEFVVEMYSLVPYSSDRFMRDDVCIEIQKDTVLAYDTSINECIEIESIDELLEFLDKHFKAEDIFSNIILRGVELRSILAKSDRRHTSKDITRNLIRVKSSNVWAYGVEIKDNDVNVGDVYIQFKGKNGGPADIYKYYDVPVKLWRKFITYPSKGAFVWKYLRNNFMYSKLTGDKRGKLSNAIN